MRPRDATKGAGRSWVLIAESRAETVVQVAPLGAVQGDSRFRGSGAAHPEEQALSQAALGGSRPV
jgi:hypothetical protein